MTLREAVLAGHARAWGKIADHTRANGGTYYDAHAWVCRIFREAGAPEPKIADFEEKMYECDEAEAGYRQ